MQEIYEASDEPYFGEVKLFPKEFLEQYENNPNAPQNIPSEIKNKIKTLALEKSLYSQVVMIRQRTTDKKGQKGSKYK